MNWRTKARLAKAISLLPNGMSHKAYYLLQRHFGNLRAANPTRCLKAGVAMVDLIRKYRPGLTGSETFLEVGTGRCVSLPIALWLCGAFRIITIDRNRYLKAELVFEELEYIKHHKDKVAGLFGLYSQKAIFRERFEQLVNCSRKDLDFLLSCMNIRYVAPADPGALDLPGQSVDYHVSHLVVEHIDRESLNGVVTEANRVLKGAGLAIHYATLADLFSDLDPSISPVNFLQFDEEEWASIAGNRYMYHNRLRVDELQELFERVGFEILWQESKVDLASLQLIRSGQIALDARFRGKSPETNASKHVWIMAAPPGSNCVPTA